MEGRRGREAEEGAERRRHVVKWKQHVTELVLLLGAAGAGAFLYLDKGKATDTERRDRDHDVFPAFRRADIDAIELTEGAVTLKLSHRAATDGGDSSWQILSPLEEIADPAAVDQLIGDLEFAGVIRKVDATTATGFDAPRVRGTLSMKSLVYHFALGGPAPIPDGAAYLRVDGEGTFVVSRDFVKALLSPADTYRNRTVVPYLSIDLAHLEVTAPGGHFVVDRADEVSFRFADGGLRVSRDAMDRVWGALAEARAESFLTDVDADHALDPAAVHVVMTPKDAARPKGELFLGGACPGHPESIIFVRRSPTRASACVPRGSLPGLETPRDELGDRHLFASRPDEVEQVILETVPPGAVVELARKGRGWHERKPADRELAGPEAEAANLLVTSLTRGAATRITKDGDGPAFVAKARARLKRGGSAVEEVVELGTTPGVVRRVFDGAILEVSPALAHRIWPSEIALRGPSVFPAGFAGRTPASLAVHCDGVTEALTRDASGWTMREPRGFSADSVAVSDLVGLVQNAQADSWIADADDGTFGFSASPCRVDVTYAGDGGAHAVGLVFGKESDDGASYAHVSGDAAVFLAPRLLREGPRHAAHRSQRVPRRPGPNVERVTLSRGSAKRTFHGREPSAMTPAGAIPRRRCSACSRHSGRRRCFISDRPGQRKASARRRSTFESSCGQRLARGSFTSSSATRRWSGDSGSSSRASTASTRRSASPTIDWRLSSERCERPFAAVTGSFCRSATISAQSRTPRSTHPTAHATLRSVGVQLHDATTAHLPRKRFARAYDHQAPADRPRRRIPRVRRLRGRHR